MQESQILSHAVELYLFSCEALNKPPKDIQEKVGVCIDHCKNINKNVAEAFSKQTIDEQLEFLDKAVKSGIDFRSFLFEFEDKKSFPKDVILGVAELSYRTEKEIKEFGQILLNG